MPHYRRKPRINDKIRIGSSSPLQQSIFKLVELNTWTQPIEIITKVKRIRFIDSAHPQLFGVLYHFFQE